MGFAPAASLLSEGGSALKRCRVAGTDDGRRGPTHLTCQFLGDWLPLLWVPTSGRSNEGASEVDHHEGRQLSNPSGGNELSVWIAEHKVLVGEFAEKLPSAFGLRGNYPCGAAIGVGEPSENPIGGIEDPRTLVGVGVEHHGDEMKELELLVESAVVTPEGMQNKISWKSFHVYKVSADCPWFPS
jgi:hypothetical protein